MEWKPEKLCTDVGEYELLVERHKNSWHCHQKREEWNWSVIHAGHILATGKTGDEQKAMHLAEMSVPVNAKANPDDCGCK